MKQTSILTTAAAGWGARIVAAFAQLVVIRLLVDYLGIDAFALFSVFLAYWGFMAVTDYGVGPALANRISAFRAAGDAPDALIKTAAVVVGIIILVNLPMAAVINHAVVTLLLEPNFGDTANLWLLSYASFALLSIRGAGETVYRVFFAEHRGVVSVVSPAVANILSLVFLVVAGVVFPGGGLPVAIGAVFTPFIIVTGGLWVYRLRRTSGSAVSMEHIRPLVMHSRGFFVYTFLNAGLIQVDYLVMARILESEEIVAYTLLMRLSMFLLYFYAVYLQIFWPKSAEGIIRGEGGTMMKNARLAYAAGMVAVVAAFAVLAPARELVFRLFNAGQVTPGASLVWLFCLLVIIRTWTETHATLLASANRLKMMNTAMAAQLLLTIALQSALGLRYGAAGIVWGSIMGYAACGAWLFPRQFARLTASSG